MMNDDIRCTLCYGYKPLSDEEYKKLPIAVYRYYEDVVCEKCAQIVYTPTSLKPIEDSQREEILAAITHNETMYHKAGDFFHGTGEFAPGKTEKLDLTEGEIQRIRRVAMLGARFQPLPEGGEHWGRLLP